MVHKITKHFRRGDIVTWGDDPYNKEYFESTYGYDCEMTVVGYDSGGWCVVKYINPIHYLDKNRRNGHPDSSLKLVKPNTILPEELFEL